MKRKIICFFIVSIFFMLATVCNARTLDDVAFDSNNDVIVVGDFTAKLSGKNGSVEWALTDEGNYVVVDSNDNVLTAETTRQSGWIFSFKLKKYRNDGIELFSKEYEKIDSLHLSGIAIDSSDNIFLYGYGYHNFPGPFYIHVIKINGEDGNKTAELIIKDGPINEEGIAIDDEDNVFILTPAEHGDDFKIFKYDNNLQTEIWSKTYKYIDEDLPANGTYSPKFLKVDGNDNIIVAGQVLTYLYHEPEELIRKYGIFLTKIDNDGYKMWSLPKVYIKDGGCAYIKDLAIEENSNDILVAGSTGLGDYPFTTDDHWLIIRYNSRGQKICLSNAREGYSSGVSFDKFSNIIGTGCYFNNEHELDCTVKYTPFFTEEWWEINDVDVPSRPSKPYNPSPRNDEFSVSTDPTLSVTVSDPNDDPMTVTFYNASDDSIIGSCDEVPTGSSASVVWNGLGYDREYKWYVIADDGITGETKSKTWRFETDEDEDTSSSYSKTFFIQIFNQMEKRNLFFSILELLSDHILLQ